MRVSAAEAKKSFSRIMKQAHQMPVIVTRHGEPDVVLLSFQEYKHLQRLQAYLKMMRLSQLLQDSGVTATELYETSREALEAESGCTD